MAKDPAASKAKNGPAMLVVIALLLTLVGAGCGFAVGALLAPKTPAPAAAAPSEPAAETEQKPAKPATEHGASGGTAADEAAPPPVLAEVQEPMIILPLPPILTNIAEPKETWIRFEGALLMKKETEDPSAILAERAGEQILDFLRTVKLTEIAGASGMLHLRDDLNDTVSAASHGQVKEVLIHTMVME